jgi:hypothetical protein
LLTLFVFGLLATLASTVAVVYGRGYLRTFAIGALFPCVPLFLWWLYYGAMALIAVTTDPSVFGGGFSPGGTPDDSVPRLGVGIYVGGMTGAILLCGLFAMLVRWLIERAQRPEPVDVEPATEPDREPEL